MCMQKVTERGLNVSGVGWKVFRLLDTKRVMGEYHDGVLRIGVWESKRAYPPDLSRMSILKGWYESGFHVFETLAGAECWNSSMATGKVILKVKYRRGHTRGSYIGWDDPMPCMVADEITIVKEGGKKK